MHIWLLLLTYAVKLRQKSRPILGGCRVPLQDVGRQSYNRRAIGVIQADEQSAFHHGYRVASCWVIRDTGSENNQRALGIGTCP